MNENKFEQMVPLLEKTLGKKILFNQDALVQETESGQTYDAPLYIKILSIFGGLLGSLALLGFFGLSGLYESAAGLIVFGAASVVGSVFLNKVVDSLLLDTGSVSIYVIGYILLGLGLLDLNIDDNVVCLIFVLLAVTTALLSSSYVLIFISILIASGGLLAFGLINEVFNLIHAYIALFSVALTAYYSYEPKINSRYQRLINAGSAVRVGLNFSLIMGLIVVGIRGIAPLSYQYVWTSSIFTIACVIAVLARILKILNITDGRQRLFILIGATVVLIPTAISPAISGALLLMLLNYKINYKTGVFIGIIAFLFFISRFYYDLNFTLLTKSILLIMSGLAFMIFYFLLHKNFKNEAI